MDLRGSDVTCETSPEDEFFWWKNLFWSGSFCDRELGGIDVGQPGNCFFLRLYTVFFLTLPLCTPLLVQSRS